MIVRLEGLEQIIRATSAVEVDKRRATKSALSSVGFFLIQGLKEQIKTQGRYAGSRWKIQHPLTRLPKRRTGRSVRLNIGRNRPLGGLKRFTRYRVSPDLLQVLFARSKKGRVGEFDFLMNEFIRRSEFGQIQQLTAKSKRWRAAMGFAVRKETVTITIPKRPIVNAVYRKHKRDLLPLFKTKFDASLERQIQERIERQSRR